MNAATKRLAARKKLNRELADRDAKSHCAYCRVPLPKLGAVWLMDTNQWYCTTDCREAARERAAIER